MASPPADRDVRLESAEASRPEPACLEAQKWIEAVTGKSFGDKDFRSALENGILLCELLSAIRPGLVKKINRLPTPIAGLDNLSVFLRGCEELGLKGSQLFDPGDLQDTSIRANLKDSDCSRKLKNVLNTVFWLGKASSGCASYSGPTLDLKEFEGLLANMKVDSDEAADGSQKRSIRDSGYDCWDSERSESLSPPRHTRDNSLDRSDNRCCSTVDQQMELDMAKHLDSFGSRSQHSPSPDVANRGNTEGRDGNLEADSGRRPDVQKDDMSARRAASGEARTPVVFNQFLPNRSNAGFYVLNAKRRPLAEDGEQRSPDKGKKSVSWAQDHQSEKEVCERTRLQRLEKAGIKVLPAALRYGRKEEVGMQKEKTADVTNDVPPSSGQAELGKASKTDDPPRKKASRVGDDDLPPMMMSHRVAFVSGDSESVSMSDMVDQDQAGHLPQLSQSRYERMHEQYNNYEDDDDQWQSDLARWKNRRRCASQELIKKEEERKRMERMKGDGGDKRKNIKTYKEIVEEKERREAELCEAYRSASTPEEAATVLQRYALRFTISDATLDFLKLPRSTANPDLALNQAQHEHKTVCEDSEPQSTQQNTCDDLHRGLEKDPLTSESTPPLSQETREPPARASPSEPEPATKVDAEPQPKPAKPKPSPPHPTKPALTLPSPPPPTTTSRPVPLLAAKPYRQPRSAHGVKMDGLVRVNGDTDTSPLHSPKDKNILVTQAEEQEEDEAPFTLEMRGRSPPPQAATSSSSSASFSSSSSSTISSLFSGRNCITKTTIVTELTQTLVEPHGVDIDGHGQVTIPNQVDEIATAEKPAEEKQSQSSSSSTSVTSIQDHCPSVAGGQEESSVSIETPMLNLAKRVNHWVWDPNEERKRVERWQQEQERLLQYHKEQEKLKKEWEKAQLEVQEEERKHNEEERKILEETVAPLKPCVTPVLPPAADKKNVSQLVPLQQNGHKDARGSEEQHASKVHFLQDTVSDTEPAKKSELWKTASLDRNSQPNPSHGVKRCDSHDGIAGTQQPPSSPLPPSPSRCVSGKRQCSGCSQPLGKGAAMIIETLGLFFHMQCFKCGLCEGELGDAAIGTDVRIRNGLLSCHHCYLASRGRGQPTTL
ncbi:LIM and calponin homology domains-containing protein 1-like isoform X3 [Hippocampus comes]|uniref:LIM and calponin homology domains-containing protein 1-like isoform X3 n=1 Tax=Hippocampus comes TaxID=109280 RepID=UPI00094EF4E9|nr:PREDICTED: LIM and calponin homology domains-containing protein 1-like isoform X3 [Hippocampus comes]